MFDSIPIYQRLRYILILLGCAFAISLLYGYQTLGIYERIDELERKTAVVQDADLQIVNRQVRLKELGLSIRNRQKNEFSLNSHADFLRYTETACSDLELQLLALPLESVEDLDGYLLARIDLSVQGRFHDILSLLYRMEFQDRVASADRIHLEHKFIRIRNQKREVLIASIRINRLLTSNNPQNASHE